MESFNDYVLPFLEGNNIRYQDNGIVKSMAVDYFKNNFKKVAATECPNIGQRSYYYQSLEDPNLVLRFRTSESAGLSATLMRYSDFEKQLKAMSNL